MKLRRNRFVPTWRIKNIHVEIFDFPRGDDYDTCRDARLGRRSLLVRLAKWRWDIAYFCTFVLHTTVKKRGGLRYARPPACYFHYD